MTSGLQTSCVPNMHGIYAIPQRCGGLSNRQLRGVWRSQSTPYMPYSILNIRNRKMNKLASVTRDIITIHAEGARSRLRQSSSALERMQRLQACACKHGNVRTPHLGGSRSLGGSQAVVLGSVGRGARTVTHSMWVCASALVGERVG